MKILKKLEKRLLAGPGNDPAHPVLMQLAKALCLNEDFRLAEIYELGYEDFELALNILKDWRLDRYTRTKERLREIVQA